MYQCVRPHVVPACAISERGVAGCQVVLIRTERRSFKMPKHGHRCFAGGCSIGILLLLARRVVITVEEACAGLAQVCIQ